MYFTPLTIGYLSLKPWFYTLVLKIFVLQAQIRMRFVRVNSINIHIKMKFPPLHTFFNLNKSESNEFVRAKSKLDRIIMSLMISYTK
jgi:hypothetical protein